MALGGDGFLLQTLRDTMGPGNKVYAIKRCTIGFLLTEYRVACLAGRISAAAAWTTQWLRCSSSRPNATDCSALVIADT